MAKSTWNIKVGDRVTAIDHNDDTETPFVGTAETCYGSRFWTVKADDGSVHVCPVRSINPLETIMPVDPKPQPLSDADIAEILCECTKRPACVLGGHRGIATIAALCREVQAARRFKAYVHQRLDEAGISTHPDGPHSKEGCRVGDRLDIALGAPPVAAGAPSQALTAEDVAVLRSALSMLRDIGRDATADELAPVVEKVEAIAAAAVGVADKVK